MSQVLQWTQLEALICNRADRFRRLPFHKQRQDRNAGTGLPYSFVQRG